MICDEKTKVDFKKVTAELGTYRDAIEKLIEIYETWPELITDPKLIEKCRRVRDNNPHLFEAVSRHREKAEFLREKSKSSSS